MGGQGAVTASIDCLHRVDSFLQQFDGLLDAQGLPYFHVLDTAMQCKSSIGCRIRGKVVVNKAGEQPAVITVGCTKQRK